MKIKHLLEGSAPKLPGAFNGVEVMTPQQFLSQAGDEPEQGVAEAGYQSPHAKLAQLKAKYDAALKSPNPNMTTLRRIRDEIIKLEFDLGLKEGVSEAGFPHDVDHMPGATIKNPNTGCKRCNGHGHVWKSPEGKLLPANDVPGAKRYKCGACKGAGFVKSIEEGVMSDLDIDRQEQNWDAIVGYVINGVKKDMDIGQMELNLYKWAANEHVDVDHELESRGFSDLMDLIHHLAQNGGKYTPPTDFGLDDVDEGQEHLSRIRKLSGLDEATKLPAQQREFGGQEFQDYMKRIVGTPDVDKAGNVKVDKKGIEKYVSGKTKGDKYKMPYIHRSSVVEYLGPDGTTYDEDKVKQTLAIRPKSLLKQNEKMKHSNGDLEQFFNIGFAALTGIALDESTNKLIIVNTCPGAGACKVDCFAMKGGKIQFKAAWQSDGRILTYLLNDPDGFFNQLSAEISKEEALGKKGGYNVTIRWHDAGDFFSPEYQDLAFKLAQKHPNVKFYAYTKMAGAALAQKPSNFIINWSEGAHTSQEKQVKAQDPTLSHTKNSRIVPTDLFGDLLAKDAKGNLAKGPDGQWVVVPAKLPELKQRLAKQYGLSPNSILGYDEWAEKTGGGKKQSPVQYNVIIAPGEPDLTANTPGVLSTLLLRH